MWFVWFGVPALLKTVVRATMRTEKLSIRSPRTLCASLAEAGRITGSNLKSKSRLNGRVQDFPAVFTGLTFVTLIPATSHWAILDCPLHELSIRQCSRSCVLVYAVTALSAPQCLLNAATSASAIIAG